MNDRAAIEHLLEDVYAARARDDAETLSGFFRADGHFKVNGAEGRAESHESRRSAIGEILGTFPLLEFKLQSRVIDPPKALVHWRRKFCATNTGKMAETDVADLIEIKDGQIASLTTFFDTALAARLST